jgi:hypothetical protein
VSNLSGRAPRQAEHAEGILHRPHHGGNTLDRNSVQHLRELLARGGATPALYEAAHKDEEPPREGKHRN